MALGQMVSNVISAGLVAGWLGFRAYEWYHNANRRQDQEHEHAPEDELALLRHQQALRRRLRGGGPIVFTFSSSHGAQIFHGKREHMGMMEAADSMHGIDLLNLQLGMMDRDFDESDYEMLLALDRNNAPGQGAPVSEEQLAALPHHSYTSAKQGSGGGSSAYHQMLQARHGSNSTHGGSSSQAAVGPRSGGERSGSGGPEAPTCSICLDKFEEGSQVSALPCFHTYHKDCLESWLRQQGRASTCPICKTPVFEQAS